MARMKKHLSLRIDENVTVKFSPKERKQMKLWLGWTSEVLQQLFKEGLLAKDPKLDAVHVSLLVCGDARIRELNREHRQKDKVTDVLSFPAQENLRSGKAKIQGELFLGDLAICHPQTKRQAKEFAIGYWDEFIHLFFHGLLHLVGYDHELSRKEEKLMQKWEDRALELFSEIKKRKGT